MNKLFYPLYALLFSYQAYSAVIDGQTLIEQANKGITQLSTKQLSERLKANPNLVLIDVRTEQEINTVGTIKAAQNINIPRGWLEFRLQEYANKDTEIVVFCGTNQRSALAAKQLQNIGYTNVSNYPDGYFYWQEANNPIRLSDNVPNSALFNLPIKVSENVWSAIGYTGPSNYQNAGHNNNLSFVVGQKYVLVFNAGGSYPLAQALHDEIKKITNKPVKYVALENTQSHAMLGANYWQEQGAIIIAHQLAVDIINNKGEQILEQTKLVLKDRLGKSKIVLPDKTFQDKLVLDLGGIKAELRYFGATHSPENITLWLPKQKLLITGDNAFSQRMLPLFVETDIDSWLLAWEKMLALKPEIIIPGHGSPTDIKTITKFTIDYLVYIREEISKILANDGDLVDAYNIDQSQFKSWDTFRELNLQNVSRLFQKMEFE